MEEKSKNSVFGVAKFGVQPRVNPGQDISLCYLLKRFLSALESLWFCEILTSRSGLLTFHPQCLRAYLVLVTQAVS